MDWCFHRAGSLGIRTSTGHEKSHICILISAITVEIDRTDTLIVTMIGSRVRGNMPLSPARNYETRPELND